MSITIRRVYDSAEASTFADITLASSVSNAYINALYPDGVTSHILSNTIERLTKAIEAPNSICILAETDEEPKKPIGTAIWYTHDEPYEGLSEPVLQNVDGQRNELHLDFQRKSWEGHQSLLIGKRVIKLFNMFVLPQYHRQGIGSKLLQECMQMADEKGLPIFLQGTPAGRPFYEKLGFERVGGFDVDLSKYQTGAGMYKMTFLQREPQLSERST